GKESSIALAMGSGESILPHQRMVVRGFFNWGWTRIFTTLICFFAGEWRMASYVFALCLLPRVSD
ncbi:hypothetical protein, partial [Klebsiella aerogenes]|uniref:hypothetical protein n=1 Tax=Klebsiella aerogenes TaxID=548 RepID=UPI001953CF41